MVCQIALKMGYRTEKASCRKKTASFKMIFHSSLDAVEHLCWILFRDEFAVEFRVKFWYNAD